MMSYPVTFSDEISWKVSKIDDRHIQTKTFLAFYKKVLAEGVFGITETLRETCFKCSALECDVTQPAVVVYGIREKW